MFEAFISGLLQVLSWPAFGFLLLGAFVGFVVGILPGLGGLATLALMLPFAYKIQEPISAFAFLLGMHAITGTTGDLTSILFGIPGEGTAAATIMDGYPMTKNGDSRTVPLSTRAIATLNELPNTSVREGLSSLRDGLERLMGESL